MNVIKRNGISEPVRFDKVTKRIESQCNGLNPLYINPVEVAQKVIDGLYDGVSTAELDTLAAEVAASLVTRHPDYSLLASRISVTALHENTMESFADTMSLLFHYVNPQTGMHSPLVSEQVLRIAQDNQVDFAELLDYSRDFSYDYFGFKTLEKSYLLRIEGKVIERPQHMLLRVAIGIHGDNLPAVRETYTLMSEKWYTHATPTLFNAGTPTPQMSSCFLLTMQDDSIDGIYDTLKQCAKISQSAGGIGLAIHNIRAKGSYIRGTGGHSNGIVPMLRNFDMTARYVDQGGGKRKGSFAIYLEPWHADIFEFLDLKKNHGKEEMRARDLFYALWIPDLFMQRVEKDESWSIFCPNEAPWLSDVYGSEFEALYSKYERDGKARKQVSARELWATIMESQIETGTPYILYKDTANRKSNQRNLGTIKSSNLCTEIIQYTSPNEVAVCNLASISLPNFITEGCFDFVRLKEVVEAVTRNLNQVIDVNHYPIPEARYSNLKHRPIGIGVQGLADVFIKLRMPFDSDLAKQLNKDIFETIYFGAVTASMDLARKDGAYESFQGSPISKGIFQFDMWNVTPSNRWNWAELRQLVIKHGVRNSLLVAPMPTASTSQILGNNECFEAYTSNIYTRRTISGEFIVVNKHLMHDLISLGLWNDGIRQQLIAANGSIQAIAGIPTHIKELYKTVWEISQKVIIDMSADRGAFICQSQSLNIHLLNPNVGKLTSMHFHAWKMGLKTGMYYLRTQAAAQAIQFTVDKSKTNTPIKVEEDLEVIACSIDNPENCLMCGS